MIFVRHGRAVVQPDVPAPDWLLDPAHTDAIVGISTRLPALPVVCSDMRRAIDTARFFGAPTIDPRLAEVSRPWVESLDGLIDRYLAGDTVDGWEPQADARARVAAAVEQYGEAIYVSHGTALSLYLASIVPGLDAMELWIAFRSPDAWQLDGSQLTRVPGGS